MSGEVWGSVEDLEREEELYENCCFVFCMAVHGGVFTTQTRSSLYTSNQIVSVIKYTLIDEPLKFVHIFPPRLQAISTHTYGATFGKCIGD